MKKSNAVIWGLILVGIGLILLVDNFTRVNIWRFIWMWWPLILVAMGAGKLVQYFRYRESKP
jgi:uncharacterized integral membrane protein